MEVVAKEAIIVVFICDTHATGCTHPQLRPLYKFLYILLNVLVQNAYKMGLQKNQIRLKTIL
jgi:hypothetical protein